MTHSRSSSRTDIRPHDSPSRGAGGLRFPPTFTLEGRASWLIDIMDAHVRAPSAARQFVEMSTGGRAMSIRVVQDRRAFLFLVSPAVLALVAITIFPLLY